MRLGALRTLFTVRIVIAAHKDVNPAASPDPHATTAGMQSGTRAAEAAADRPLSTVRTYTLADAKQSITSQPSHLVRT